MDTSSAVDRRINALFVELDPRNDFKNIPIFDVKAMDHYPWWIASTWKKVEEIARRSLSSMITKAFPNVCASPETKYEELERLDVAVAALDKFSQAYSIGLLFKRAVINIQCGYALAADRDLAMFELLRSQFLDEALPAFSQSDISLLRVFTLLMFKDPFEAKPYLLSWWNEWKARNFKLSDQMNNHSLHLQVDEEIIVPLLSCSDVDTSGIQSFDKFFKAALLVCKVFELSGLIDETVSFVLPRFLIDYHMALLQQHLINIECPTNEKSSDLFSKQQDVCFQYDDLTHCDKPRMDRLRAVLEDWKKLCPIFCELPLSYRGNLGDGRDVSHVVARFQALFDASELENINVGLTEQLVLTATRTIHRDEIVLVENPLVMCIGQNGIEKGNILYCRCCLSLLTEGADVCYCKLDCGYRYCSEACSEMDFHQLHSLLCSNTPSGRQWQSFCTSTDLPLRSEAAYYQCALMALKLMMLAAEKGVASALELPEIRILSRPTDSPVDPRCALDPLTCHSFCNTQPVSVPMDVEYLRPIFLFFQKKCPLLWKPFFYLSDFIILVSLLQIHARFSKCGDGTLIGGLFVAASFVKFEGLGNVRHIQTVRNSEVGSLLGQIQALRDIEAGEVIVFPANHTKEYCALPSSDNVNIITLQDAQSSEVSGEQLSQVTHHPCGVLPNHQQAAVSAPKDGSDEKLLFKDPSPPPTTMGMQFNLTASSIRTPKKVFLPSSSTGTGQSESASDIVHKVELKGIQKDRGENGSQIGSIDDCCMVVQQVPSTSSLDGLESVLPKNLPIVLDKDTSGNLDAIAQILDPSNCKYALPPPFLHQCAAPVDSPLCPMVNHGDIQNIGSKTAEAFAPRTKLSCIELRSQSDSTSTAISNHSPNEPSRLPVPEGMGRKEITSKIESNRNEDVTEQPACKAKKAVSVSTSSCDNSRNQANATREVESSTRLLAGVDQSTLTATPTVRTAKPIKSPTISRKSNRPSENDLCTRVIDVQEKSSPHGLDATAVARDAVAPDMKMSPDSAISMQQHGSNLDSSSKHGEGHLLLMKPSFAEIVKLGNSILIGNSAMAQQSSQPPVSDTETDSLRSNPSLSHDVCDQMEEGDWTVVGRNRRLKQTISAEVMSQEIRLQAALQDLENQKEHTAANENQQHETSSSPTGPDVCNISFAGSDSRTNPCDTGNVNPNRSKWTKNTKQCAAHRSVLSKPTNEDILLDTFVSSSCARSGNAAMDVQRESSMNNKNEEMLHDKLLLPSAQDKSDEQSDSFDSPSRNEELRQPPVYNLKILDNSRFRTALNEIIPILYQVAKYPLLEIFPILFEQICNQVPHTKLSDDPLTFSRLVQMRKAGLYSHGNQISSLFNSVIQRCLKNTQSGLSLSCENELSLLQTIVLDFGSFEKRFRVPVHEYRLIHSINLLLVGASEQGLGIFLHGFHHDLNGERISCHARMREIIFHQSGENMVNSAAAKKALYQDIHRKVTTHLADANKPISNNPKNGLLYPDGCLQTAWCVIQLYEQWKDRNHQSAVRAPAAWGSVDAVIFLLLRFLVTIHVFRLNEKVLRLEKSRSNPEVDVEYERLLRARNEWEGMLAPILKLKQFFRMDSGDANEVCKLLGIKLENSGFDTKKRGSLIALEDITAGGMIVTERSLISFPIKARTCTGCYVCNETISSEQFRCVECCVVFCSVSCQTEAMQKGHDVFCEATYVGKKWKTFLSQFGEKAIVDSQHCMIMTFQLMILAHVRQLPSALELPAIKILRRITDPPDEVGALQAIIEPQFIDVKLQTGMHRKFRLWKAHWVESMDSLQSIEFEDFVVLNDILSNHVDTFHDYDDENLPIRMSLFVAKSLMKHSDQSNCQFLYDHDDGDVVGKVIALDQTISKHSEIRLSK